MSIDVNSSFEQIQEYLKSLPLFSDQEFSVTDSLSFMHLVDGVPENRENELPEELIAVYNHYSSIEMDKRHQLDPSDEPKKKSKTKPKWDGEGEPFRPGSKYDEVFGLILNKSYSRAAIAEFLTEKYGEKTGSASNTGVYIKTIQYKLSDFYDMTETPEAITLTRK